MTGVPAKPTVLVLASTYPRWPNDHEPGFVHELCRRLVGHFNVIALVPDAEGAEPDGDLDGVEVVRFAYAPRPWQTLAHSGGITINLRRHKWKWALVPPFVLAQYLAARRLLRNRRVEVIHAHWLLPQGLIARRLSRAFGIPYVVTSHGGDLFGLRGHFPTALKRPVARDCAAMTVVSSAMRDEAKRIGLQPPRLDVLPMGVDLQTRFTPGAGRARAHNELLFVGRLVPKKGLSYLLDALPRVIAERPDTRLTIVGSGPEEGSLRAQAQQLGIEAAISFLGPRKPDELPELYRRASLFVSPFVRDESGDQEGLPVALMEAIGCGCPPLVGNVPGIIDLLGDSAAQVCIEPRDTTQVAAAILGVLNDREGAQARVDSLRRRIVEIVDWTRIAAAYADLLSASLRPRGLDKLARTE
jgi:glycosyltransferase involved in cell wall biosynthesis